VPIRLLGRDITANPELISAPDQVEELLETMIKINPTTAPHVRTPHSESGRLNRAALENALHYGFRIVRWHLDKDDSTDPNEWTTGGGDRCTKT
jgi:hypothetical protein